jgi:hypothetical protein
MEDKGRTPFQIARYIRYRQEQVHVREQLIGDGKVIKVME